MRYAAVVDAGSSGSRIHVYAWDATRGDSAVLPQVYSTRDWVAKINPGISSYAGRESQIWTYLEPLVAKAEEVVPAEARHETPFYFLATAGLRLLPEAAQQRVLEEVCTQLQKHTSFYIPECTTHVALIDGQTEGLFGWLGLNYLVHTRDGDQWTDFETTYGFMDMGGASAQIAFQPNATESVRHADDLHTLTLRTLDGADVSWHIFVSTWLGFGANQAQYRHRHALLAKLEQSELEGAKSGEPVPVLDPCLPLAAIELHTERLGENGPGFDAIYYGQGDFSKCIRELEPLLNNDRPCIDDPCLFDGVHVPAFDLEHQKFIGVSEYWYTTEDLFKLGGKFDYAAFVARASEFCEANWETIESRFNDGAYGNIDRQNLMLSCFKSAWVLSILHKGFKFPLNPHEPSAHHNFLDTFQSVANIGGLEVTWTLGRALLYASSQVPGSYPDSPGVGVGVTASNGYFLHGGELTSSRLPVKPIPLPSKKTAFPIAAVAIVAMLLILCRLSRSHFLARCVAKLRSWTGTSWSYESVLPTEEPPRQFSGSSSTFVLQDFTGASTSSQPPSNVPSRVSSRVNMREDD